MQLFLAKQNCNKNYNSNCKIKKKNDLTLSNLVAKKRYNNIAIKTDKSLKNYTINYQELTNDLFTNLNLICN